MPAFFITLKKNQVRKIVFIVRNIEAGEFYAIDKNDNIILTTDYNHALQFESEEEILAYEKDGFQFPVNCDIHSIIINN